MEGEGGRRLERVGELEEVGIWKDREEDGSIWGEGDRDGEVVRGTTWYINCTLLIESATNYRDTASGTSFFNSQANHKHMKKMWLV